MKRFFTSLFTVTLFISACSKKNTVSNNNPVIRTNTSSVTTFAGTGSPGSADGTKQFASFNSPTGIAISTDGFLFIADRQNNAIRIISPQGVVNVIAGTGSSGFSNTAGSVAFNFPSGVAVDGSGNVFVADEDNSVIRKIDLQGVTTTFAGNGQPGSKNGNDTSARFSGPTGIIADSKGNLYVADNFNSLIRKITPNGVVTTLAGNGLRGSADGMGAAASFNQPQAVAVDSSGNVYVADEGNNLIRKITPQGLVTTIAGSGTAGAANGVGTAASFNGPAGIAVDASGNLYVGDSNNNLVRKISSNGTVTTLAGSGTAGSANGALTSASFNSPQGVAVDTYGRVFVADTGNSDIRMISQ
jgi:sugar lactone lactonase YvrE